MRKLIKESIILIVSAGLLWALFALFIKLPEKPVLISREKELILGEKYKNAILSLNDFSKIEDPGIDSILSSISDKISSLIEYSRYDLSITLVRNDLVNAFALPAGNIIITTGLVEFCESSEELFAVISHETAHIIKRHLISRLIKDVGIQLLFSDNSYVTAEIVKGIISSGYNRRQEEEADFFSCELLAKSGIEPRILASFLRRLKDHIGHESFSNFEIVSSHPDFDKRIRNILLFNGKTCNEMIHIIDIQDLEKRIEHYSIFK